MTYQDPNSQASAYDAGFEEGYQAGLRFASEAVTRHPAAPAAEPPSAVVLCVCPMCREHISMTHGNLVCGETYQCTECCTPLVFSVASPETPAVESDRAPRPDETFFQWQERTREDDCSNCMNTRRELTNIPCSMCRNILTPEIIEEARNHER